MKASALLEWLLFPPGGILLLGLAGVLLWPRRSGLLLSLLAVTMLWAASTPKFSYLLVDSLQRQHAAVDPDTLQNGGAQAIVVLAAGRENATPDFGDTISRLTLARVRYAAHLHRQTGLPVIASGGAPGRAGGQPAGRLMQQVLQDAFGVEAPWSEERSANTYENALFTRELLADHGIERVLLVTQAVHMPRAVAAFEAAGFSVIPAPTDYVMRGRGVYEWLPDIRSLTATNLALHEIIGTHWYRWHYDLRDDNAAGSASRSIR